MAFYMGDLLNFEAPGLFFANRSAYVRLLLYQHQDPYQIFRLSYAEADLYLVLTRPPRLQMRISTRFLQEIYCGKNYLKFTGTYIHTLKHNLQKFRFLQVSYYQVFYRFSFFLLNILSGYVLILESCARLLIYLRKGWQKTLRAFNCDLTPRTW